MENVVLDVGKVLVEFDPNGLLHRLGITGEDAKEVALATYAGPIWDEVDRSAEGDGALLGKMIARSPGREGQIRLFWGNVGGSIWRYGYAEEWISRMKGCGLGVYILSNYSSWMFEHTREQLSFLGMADGSLFSYEVGHIKPEREIYDAFFERFALDPASCLFFDDREDNIRGAAAAGMEGVLFTSYGDAIAALRERGAAI